MKMTSSLPVIFKNVDVPYTKLHKEYIHGKIRKKIFVKNLHTMFNVFRSLSIPQ